MATRKIDLAKFKKLLESERKQLVSELSKVGEVNPDDPKREDWEFLEDPRTETESDPVDAADHIEESDKGMAIEITLETSLHNVDKALEAIKKKTYGTCMVGDKPHDIPIKRLEANPAATTCIDHAS